MFFHRQKSRWFLAKIRPLKAEKTVGWSPNWEVLGQSKFESSLDGLGWYPLVNSEFAMI